MTKGQRGATWLARNKGVMGVPETLVVRQPISESVRISKSVKKRVKKDRQYRNLQETPYTYFDGNKIVIEEV